MNVFKALKFFQPSEFKSVSHMHFRVLLAHAMITLGSVPFNPEDNQEEKEEEENHLCKLKNFSDIDKGRCPGHKCAYCPHKAYYFCSVCFPDDDPSAACCNPSTGRPCFTKHVMGFKIKHFMRRHASGGAAVRSSPRLQKAATQARAPGAAASGAVPRRL